MLGAERFAVFAGLLCGARYPEAALAKAWVQLAYGAHHDAITGSESDQVYLDLLTSWRDAWELGRTARSGALRLLSSAVAAESDLIVVWNPLAHKRTDVATVHLESPIGPSVRVVDSNGTDTAALVEHGGHTVSWLARDVASLGWRTYRLVPAEQSSGWQPIRNRRSPTRRSPARRSPTRRSPTRRSPTRRSPTSDTASRSTKPGEAAWRHLSTKTMTAN